MPKATKTKTSNAKRAVKAPAKKANTNTTTAKIALLMSRPTGVTREEVLI